jgi:transcription antitermination factor NusG
MPTSQTIDVAARGDSDWWALYTRHQHEKTVADMLSAKGFEVFLPQYESMRRWKDRSKLLSLPLFPCYVFVRGGLHRRLQVVTTPGVHMILYYGESVAIIPEDEIQAIRKTVEGPFRVEPHPYLKCGDRVRVTRGTMEGVEGILIRKKNLYRLVLSVEMLAQSVAVEIDGSDVEPVAPRGVANSMIMVGESAGAERFREAVRHGGGQLAGVRKEPISVG